MTRNTLRAILAVPLLLMAGAVGALAVWLINPLGPGWVYIAIGPAVAVLLAIRDTISGRIEW